MKETLYDLPPIRFVSDFNRSIRFSYGDIELNKSKSPLATDTFTKLISGLNHFLVYFYHTDIDAYTNIISIIQNTIVNIHNDIVELQDITNVNQHSIELDILLKKYCSFENNKELLQYFVRYINDNKVENIDESLARTEITLTNHDANILSTLTIAVKFAFIFSSLMRGNIVFDETLYNFGDAMTQNVIDVYIDMMDSELTKDADEETIEALKLQVHSNIDNFIYQLVNKVWISTNTTAYRQKFKDNGVDSLDLSKQHKVTILSAFKKYIPPIISAEIGRTYIEDSSMSDSDIIKAVWYQETFKDYRDFKFININMMKYVQFTIESIMKKKSTKGTISTINQSDFIFDTAQGIELQQRVNGKPEVDNNIFTKIRKFKAEKFFKHICEKCSTDYTEHMDFIKENTKLININKNHKINLYIMNVIFLDNLGEYKNIYSLYGEFNKFILMIFYITIKSNNEIMEKFNIESVLNSILSEVTQFDTTSINDIENIINSNKEEYSYVNDSTDVELINSMCKTYKYKDTYIEVKPREVLDFIYLLNENREYVRSLILPEYYKNIDMFEDIVEHVNGLKLQKVEGVRSNANDDMNFILNHLSNR